MADADLNLSQDELESSLAMVVKRRKYAEAQILNCQIRITALQDLQKGAKHSRETYLAEEQYLSREVQRRQGT